MLLHIAEILSPAQIAECRQMLAGAEWLDGRNTAGHLSAPVKHNLQLHWQDPVAERLGGMVVGQLRQDPIFLSAALPRAILPPLFNCYAGGGHYGPHLDGAIRPIEGTDRRIRTDLSLTLMLSDPSEYDGGELVVADPLGDRAIKLAAGDAILYPATSIHHVEPVTRGARLAAFTWVQSLVRDDGKRRQLFELDVAIQQLPEDEAMASSRLRFSNIYHNLLRRWAEV